MKKNSFISYTVCAVLVLCLTGCSQPAPKDGGDSVPQQTQELRTGEKAARGSLSRDGEVILHETTSGRISITEARDLALSRVPGAKVEDIQIVGGYDDGIVLYKGIIHYNNKEYDFEINAYTGEFTEWEMEVIPG